MLDSTGVFLYRWRGGNVGVTDREPKSAMEIAADTAQPPAGKWAHKRRSKPQLLIRADLDGRTNAAKLFDRLAADIEADLGGRDQLSTIERALIEAFCGATVTMHALNAKLALGEEIDLTQHAQAANVMVRLASRLGLQRRAKDVSGGGGLGDLMRGSEEGQSSEEDVK